MTISEMKGYLGSYLKLKRRAERLIRDIEKFPQDKSFLEPLLQSVTETAEDISFKISEVKNPINRELLFRKYIIGETLEHLGGELCYSARHVQRLINTAIATMPQVNSNDRN